MNVRSLTAKLADTEQDMYLKAANVVCFCETWLTASQASPSIVNDQVADRCDKLVTTKVELCPRQMHPTRTRSFAPKWH